MPKIQIIILLVILVIASAAFSIYEYKKINLLTQEKNQLSNKISGLDLRIKDYLKLQGRECIGNAEFCLDDLIKSFKPIISPTADCSRIKDGICPVQCAAGSDYDCCLEKDGYDWIQGRGCFSI